MNNDIIIFENYIDKLILEDSVVLEAKMNNKVKLVAKITLTISAVVLLIAVAKKLKKYMKNNKDKKQVDSTINMLNEQKEELVKLKSKAKKSITENKNKKVDEETMLKTHDLVFTLWTKASSDGIDAIGNAGFGKTDIDSISDDVKKIDNTYRYIKQELGKTLDKLEDFLMSGDKIENISEEDSKWVKDTLKNAENYLKGRG